MINNAFFAELEKLAEVTAEEAEQARKRLKQLEKDAPTAGQLGRGAMVGAAVGPLMGAAMKAVAGSPAAAGPPIPVGAKAKVLGGARGALAQSLAGAIYSGGIPYLRHQLEHGVEEQKLREYAGQTHKGRLRGRLKKTFGV
jgi:hypothetical protein